VQPTEARRDKSQTNKSESRSPKRRRASLALRTPPTPGAVLAFGLLFLTAYTPPVGFAALSRFLQMADAKE
jgi:hypothetical protein